MKLEIKINLPKALMSSSIKNLIRLMLLIIIILAFAAGFFQSSLEVETRKNKLLRDKILKLESQTEKMEF